MNYIKVSKVKTYYDYSEYYLIIDNKPITTYLDKYVKLYSIEDLANFGSLLGLLPAWSGELIWQWENDFIWEMIDSKEELNIPILVCEDDCDLSCIVVVAHIRKLENKVCWDKIGVLDKSKINKQQYEESGILCLEAYTDEDWEKYGDNVATEKYGSYNYWQWVKENCYEENIRKLRNYLKTYMQSKENIQWIFEPKWEFEEKIYNDMVSQYRNLKQREDIDKN